MIEKAGERKKTQRGQGETMKRAPDPASVFFSMEAVRVANTGERTNQDVRSYLKFTCHIIDEF